MAELMLGQPLFPGESGIDQLVEIIKVLGTPSREQIKTMNPNYMEHKFPQIKPHPFSKVSISLFWYSSAEYRPGVPATYGARSNRPCIKDVGVYAEPETECNTGNGSFILRRITGWRSENAKWQRISPIIRFHARGWVVWIWMDQLLSITAELSVRPDLIRQLVPPHCEPELASRSITLYNFVPIPLEQLKINLDWAYLLTILCSSRLVLFPCWSISWMKARTIAVLFFFKVSVRKKIWMATCGATLARVD